MGQRKVRKTVSAQGYKPSIKVSDISSLGRSHRVFGHKTKRTHHLLSNLMLAVFLIFERYNATEDIPEQFPLDINVIPNLKINLSLSNSFNLLIVAFALVFFDRLIFRFGI